MDDGSRQQQRRRRRRGSPAATAAVPGRPRTVPIAVTPEGFWCCPSPAALHKKSVLKNPHHHHHAKQSPAPTTHKIPSAPTSRAPSVQTAPSVADDDPAPTVVVTDDQQQTQATADAPAPASGQQDSTPPPPPQQQEQHKQVCVGFGWPETSDMTVMLYGKEGITVRMSVHRAVLSQSSTFFAHRLTAISTSTTSSSPPPTSSSGVVVVEIHDCDDAEIYVETVGLMYCDEAKHRLLLKQGSVPRVLRIMKVADALGFHACVASCLRYLEAVPWVGDEEERSVVSSVRRLQQSKDKNDDDGCYYGGVASPLLKRIAGDDDDDDCRLRPRSDTFASITEMVLASTDDRGRREMKALVLNLLKDSTRSRSHGVGDGSPPPADDISASETLYGSCRGCLDRLQRLFSEAASSSSSEPSEYNSSYSPAVVTRRIALETDNLLWLVELLASQRAGDGLVELWSGQAELAASHARVPAPSRHAVSRVTARLFVGVGRRELLPPTDARLRLLHVWLHPLIDDYAWLRQSAAFDRRLVEDGIGQTILTLPLEEQRSFLMAWFGRFLKLGDDCPNLQKAFEVWWRRTFVRPFVHHLQAADSDEGDDVLTSEHGMDHRAEMVAEGSSC